VKKVIGGRNFILIVSVLFATNSVLFSQGLTRDEQDFLKALSDSVVFNQTNQLQADSFLWAISDISESFRDSVKRDEARAFYCAEYMVHSPTHSDAVFDSTARHEMIRVCEGCLVQYYHHYKTGVWNKMQFLRFLFKGLFYLNMWDRNHERALEAVKAYENEILNDSTSTVWDLMDIYSVYSDFYSSIGLYDREAKMNQLVRDNYAKNGFQTVFDTLKYLHSTQKLLEYKCNTGETELTFQLFDEYEHYFFSVDYFLKPQNEYLSVLESMAKYAVSYSLEYSKECLDQEIEFMRKIGIDTSNCPDCIFGYKSALLEYQIGMGNWKEILKILDSDSRFKITHLGLYIKAYCKIEDKQKAISSMTSAIRELTFDFDGLNRFHPVERAALIKKIIKARNYTCIRDVLLQFPNDKKVIELYQDYLIKFKALEYSINGRYEATVDFLKSKKPIAQQLLQNHLLLQDQLLLECSRLSEVKTLKLFNKISDGIYLRESAQVKGYPVIVDIDPHTYAFDSGLKIGDCILSVNSKNVKNFSITEIFDLLHSTHSDKKNKLEVIRDGVDSTLTFFTRRDSVFLYHDTILSKYIFYSIKGNSNDDFEYHPMDATLLDGKLQRQYDETKTFIAPKELQSLLQIQNGTKSIYFSADGLFNKINPETLQITDSLGKYEYLGDLLSIHILCSSRDLLLADSTRSNTKNASLFGYPDYTLNINDQERLVKQYNLDTNSLSYLRGEDAVTGTYSFKPLIATKHEVEDISNIFITKGWKVNVYTGARAMEEQIKRLQNPHVLHIATHGFFAQDIQAEKQKTFMGRDSREVENNPLLRSGLAFAGAERTRIDTTHQVLGSLEDGILTAEEAQFLTLDSTELVVLSACETGLGTIINGEGVYGLQRAFRAAGAKCVLMSLWKVDDLATETLMKNFYKHWLNDGLNKHDALWQAKLDLRNDKSHPDWAKPYYWGAFVLIGE
jgi:CHAT domain-containing protein